MTYEQEKLYEDNIKLVPYLYNEYNSSFSNYPIEKEEFIEEGYVGLFKASLNFDSSKGYTFATYASRCILHEMLQYLRKLNKCVRTISGETVVYKDNDENNLTLFDVIPSKNIFENVDDIIDLKDLLIYAVNNKVLNYNEYRCLMLSLQGLTQEKISKIVKIKQASCSRCITRAINKLTNLYKENKWLKQKGNAKSKKKQ